MKRIAFILVALLCAGVAASCVRQSKERDVEYFDRWDWRVPHGQIFLHTDPPGALIEVFDDYGNWVAIGSTSTNPGIKIEATGKKYLVRLSKPGYYPEVHWVAMEPGNRISNIMFPMTKNVYTDAEKYYEVLYPDDK